VNRLSRFNKTGRSLRDELSDLVQEDPDAAANILKSWIGQSG
jgi:flagellar biosynthesis/type III secretory pathway M-ring protein FliF/YscJ